MPQNRIGLKTAWARSNLHYVRHAHAAWCASLVRATPGCDRGTFLASDDGRCACCTAASTYATTEDSWSVYRMPHVAEAECPQDTPPSPPTTKSTSSSRSLSTSRESVRSAVSLLRAGHIMF